MSSSDSDSDSDLVGAPLKKRVLRHQDYYLSRLPDSTNYTKAIKGLEYTAIATQPFGSLLMVGSHAGHVDLRQHRLSELELVRRLEGAHNSPVKAVSFSENGRSAASLSEKRICIYDVETADQISLIELDHAASTLAWMGSDMLAVAAGALVRIYNLDGEEQQQVNVHKKPILGLIYIPRYSFAVSWDDGLIEYWDPHTGHMPHVTGVFALKSTTDLFYFRKQKRAIRTVAVAPNGKQFVALDDQGTLVVFDTLSGKRVKEIDETLPTVCEMQRLGSGTVLDEKEFKNRVGTETKQGDGPVFDASSELIIYPSLVGIKVVALKSSTTIRVYGKGDNLRFHELALLTGPSQQVSLDAAGSSNELVATALKGDPALLALAEGDLYVFGNHTVKERDTFLGDKSQALKSQVVAAGTAEPKEPSLDSRFTTAKQTLHTTLGDIEVEAERPVAGIKGAFEVKDGAIAVNCIPRQSAGTTAQPAPKYSVGVESQGVFITTEKGAFETVGKVVRGEDVVDAIAASKTRVDLL